VGKGYNLVTMAFARTSAAATERRLHHRVTLALPIRLRWPGPFRQAVEVRHTLDISRGGALVESDGPHSPGTIVWATFPFDEGLPDGFPELPARVVRVVSGERGTRVAIGFDVALPRAGGENGPRPANERRASQRQAVCVPVRVRASHLPWPEETMTLDISKGGLRFLSTCLYEPGSRVYVSLESRTFPWCWAAIHQEPFLHQGECSPRIELEVAARVMRMEPVAGSNQVAVALRRLS
jgi:hypothetical protein